MSQLHCISDTYINFTTTKRKVCRLFSGTLKAKLGGVFSKYHPKYVELIYLERKINENVTGGRYEIRLYRNKLKNPQSLFSFKINPMNLSFAETKSKSKKHPFTFICSSQGVSICFSAQTKYEQSAWLSVLQQIKWQNEPSLNKSNEREHSLSNTTPLNSVNMDATEHESPHFIDYYSGTISETKEFDDECLEYIEAQIDKMKMEPEYVMAENKFISDDSIMHRMNDKNCQCDVCVSPKSTILGILSQ